MDLFKKSILWCSPLWLKEDFSSKCEFFKPSHLLIEGCILEIGLGKTKYSLKVYLTTNFQPHRSLHVRRRAENVRARPKTRV